MTSVEAVDPAEAAETEIPHRRPWSWIPGTVIVVLFVGIAAWQGAALVGRIETGSATYTPGGMGLPDCLPSGDYWVLFDADDDVVVAHTLSNPSPWPVTVTSTDPDVYRFEPMSDDRTDDITFADRSADGGAPDGTQSAVVIPPGREAAMWIVNPQGDGPLGHGTWHGYEGAPLRIRSLGVERDVRMPYQGMLWVGGLEDSDRLGKALQEACDA
jgi:hypothetical protein